MSEILEEVGVDSDSLSPDRLPNRQQAHYLFVIGVTVTRVQNSSYASPSCSTTLSVNLEDHCDGPSHRSYGYREIACGSDSGADVSSFKPCIWWSAARARPVVRSISQLLSWPLTEPPPPGFPLSRRTEGETEPVGDSSRNRSLGHRPGVCHHSFASTRPPKMTSPPLLA